MVKKKTDFNAKITEIEGKTPSISGLATISALTAVENKIPGVGSLVKKTNYNTKINEIENKVNDHNHCKYINTPMRKTQILMNKAVYLGFSILDLNKTVMYEFWYDYVKPNYGEWMTFIKILKNTIQIKNKKY